jgi:predicted permease
MRWYQRLFRRARTERQLDAEIRFHLEQQIADYVAGGMTPEEAQRRARLEFGGLDQVKEECRDVGAARLVESLIQDVRYGLRQLHRNPGFTVVAIVTLALGIGATTAIFSVVNGVLLTLLPYPHPNQLVSVSCTAPSIKVMHLGMSAAMYFVYRDDSRAFHEVSLDEENEVPVTGVEEPEVLLALDATDELLPTLGVRPILGRLFTRADDQPSSTRTVMLAYWYWEKRFGGNRAVVGKTIDVNGKLRDIIGVLPKSFRFLDHPDIALVLPIRLDRAKTHLGHIEYLGIARLWPGVTLAEADADVARMLPIVARSFPPPARWSLKIYESVRFQPHVEPLKDEIVGSVSDALWVLMGGIVLVLLVACANAANLLLVRMEGRRQELAVRAALGASPGRIAGQLLLESFVLSLVAAALGLAFAYGGLKILVAIAPSTLPRLNEIRIDSVVLLFAVGTSLAAGLLFGSMAVLRFGGGRWGSGLRDDGRSRSGSRERRRAQNGLVIVQVGLALVLLISAGLMVRTFRALIQVQPGFSAPPAALQVLRLFIPATDASRPEQVTRMQQAILQKMEAIPGVSSASICWHVPLADTFGRDQPVWVRDRAYAEGQVRPLRTTEFIAPGFFRTLGVPIAAGRDFTWSEIYHKVPVAIVSENLAREYWRDPQDAIGKQIRMGAKDEWHEIVGVVGDVHDNGMNKPAPMVVYWPIMPASFLGQRVSALRDAALIIRTARAGSDSFVREVRRAVRSVDPNLPLVAMDTMAYFYKQSMARTSFSLVMLAVASVMALLLGAIGLFAVISYSVSQRTHDIGVRMALGAQRSDVLRLVMGQGITLSLMGVVIGVVVALGVTRFLSNLLYGVKPTDPLTFVAVSMLLTGVALLACWIPARRAAKVDPMVALRHE